MLDGTKISLFAAQQGVNIRKLSSRSMKLGDESGFGGDKGVEVLEDFRFHRISSPDVEALKGISGIAASDANGDMWLNGLSGIAAHDKS